MKVSVQGEVAGCYDKAADYYDTWLWQSVWGQTEWPLIKEFVGNPTSVLDVGVGTGVVAERLISLIGDDARRYVGVDVSPKMLDVCRVRLRDKAELVEGDIAEAVFEEGQFDFVLMGRVLTHVPEPERVFSVVAPALADGGRVLVTDIDPRHPYDGTTLPTEDGKIAVPTFKHSAERLIAGADKAGLRLLNMACVYADQAGTPDGMAKPPRLVNSTMPLLHVLLFEKVPSRQP